MSCATRPPDAYRNPKVRPMILNAITSPAVRRVFYSVMQVLAPPREQTRIGRFGH